MLDVILVNICQPVDDRAQRLRQSSFAGPLSGPYSSRRSAVLGSRALDSGGRTRTHTSEASGSRADNRRNTDSKATGLSGHRTITQHGKRDSGHSGRRTTSHHGSRQPSHGGSQGGRATATAAPRESRLSGVGTNPQQRMKTVRWGPVEYETRNSRNIT
jgi:hypothetical protein